MAVTIQYQESYGSCTVEEKQATETGYKQSEVEQIIPRTKTVECCCCRKVTQELFHRSFSYPSHMQR